MTLNDHFFYFYTQAAAVLQPRTANKLRSSSFFLLFFHYLKNTICLFRQILLSHFYFHDQKEKMRSLSLSKKMAHINYIREILPFSSASHLVIQMLFSVWCCVWQFDWDAMTEQIHHHFVAGWAVRCLLFWARDEKKSNYIEEDTDKSDKDLCMRSVFSPDDPSSSSRQRPLLRNWIAKESYLGGKWSPQF